MRSSFKLICYIFLIFGAMPLQASLPGGLKFHGSEEPINQRTSYNVFGSDSPGFSTYFDIEFNLSLYPTTEFGYILRIKNEESNRIYNLFYDGQGGEIMFKFNEEGTDNLITALLNKEELLGMQWFKMKIAFDLQNDSIKLTIHDETFATGNQQLPDSYHPIILFGKSDYIIDVPSFAIKDLAVGNDDKYLFALKENEGDVVHDIGGNAYGNVTNPEWLINDAYHWRYKAAFRSRSIAGANYNAAKKEIYYFNSDSLHVYNVKTGNTEAHVFDEKCPVELILGTNFIDTSSNKLYAYEVYYEDPYSMPTVASLDLNTYQWAAEGYEQLPTQLHHHGSYFDPSTDQYTIFGGFGSMHYSKNFFAYDVSKNAWDTLQGFTGDVISPRYFSAVGYLKQTNSIYIFGGMGNESGEQIVGRKYYYDLYKVDLNRKHITKLWEIDWDKDNVIPVRGMVILDDSSFYTLCYPEHLSESLLKLYRFSLKDGSYAILGDSIPIYSDKITTNANLYYDSGLNSLYAVVQEFEDDISSNLKVYSLAFPPITAKELASYTAGKDIDTKMAVIFLCLCSGAGILYLLFRRFRPAQSSKEKAFPDLPTTRSKPEATARPNSIYLFGDFMVRDKNNRDIANMFSTQLKQIFCVILQYSTTEDGITSQRLSGIFWPDKPADKAKNSRGVTINHLRKILNELDGIELIYDKGCFKFVQAAPFYCDYTRCLEIIAANEVGENKNEFIEIITRGKFLQLSDDPIFDSFKEEVEQKLEPVLLLELEKSFAAEQFQATVAFADAIFDIDPINEVALAFQIKAMQKLKMNDEARIKYQAFVIEYKKVMGSDYPHVIKV